MWFFSWCQNTRLPANHQKNYDVRLSTRACGYHREWSDSFRWNIPSFPSFCDEACQQYSFPAASWSRWMTTNWFLPWVAVIMYLCMLKTWFPHPRPWKTLTFWWNTCMAVFSYTGMTTLVPELFQKLMHEGFHDSVCSHVSTYGCDGNTGVFVLAFVLSKVCELFDTVLLRLKGRPIRFVHSYHHVTVLLYCWNTYASRTGSIGLWFATMNYTIHTMMYSYFALMSHKTLRPHLRGISPAITMLQLCQMFFGVVLSLYAWLTPQSCYVSRGNMCIALSMYVSYAILFWKVWTVVRFRTS